MTRKAVCVHVYVSDNRNSCVTPKIVDCPSMSTIGRSCMTIQAVCVHVTLYMNITNISRAYYK